MIRIFLGVFTVALFSLLAATGAHATPPPGTAGYAMGTSGTAGCIETPDNFSETQWLVGQSNQQPGWLKNFPDTGPPALGNRDPRNVVRIDLDNACPSPFVINYLSETGERIWGLVEAHTTYSLTGADLKLTGLWQFNIVGGGGGGCVGGGPTCYDTPVDFIVTSEGVTLTP